MESDKHNLLFSRIVEQALPGFSDKLSARKNEKSVNCRMWKWSSNESDNR